MVRTMEELWFSTPSNSSQQIRSDVLVTIPVILGVCEAFKDRQSPLEEVLSSIVLSKDSKDNKDQGLSSALRTRFSELCDAMIDGLLDASDFPNFVSLSERARSSAADSLYLDHR